MDEKELSLIGAESVQVEKVRDALEVLAIGFNKPQRQTFSVPDVIGDGLREAQIAGVVADLGGEKACARALGLFCLEMLEKLAPKMPE